MLIDCISDLHGFQPTLEGGDLLIVAGDCTALDHTHQWKHFLLWLKAQKYRKKILIAGNHDGFLERFPPGKSDCEEVGFEYLQDSGTAFEGITIWGSPWTPEFCKWHFMLPRGEKLREKWSLIPPFVDILITHGPPYGVLDDVGDQSSRVRDSNQGCVDLRMAQGIIQPRLHVFGHIHEGYGTLMMKHHGRDTFCVNASIMDGRYNPVNKPTRVTL